MSEEIEKLRAIYQLLLDLAIGRRPLPLDKRSNHNNYDDLYHSFYVLGERLIDLALTSGQITTYAAFTQISTYVFVLDSEHKILDFNTDVTERLGHIPEAIRYSLFEGLLTNDSVLQWDKQITSAMEMTPFLFSMNLVFLAKNGGQLPLFCSVTNAYFEPWIFVLSVEVKFGSEYEGFEFSNVRTNESEIVEQLHTYILTHLDEALPPIRALALRLGTGEHTLRHAFKAHYGTSIYQFYQDTRLKKGYQLILHTRLQLKDIAYQCGFSNYINFYKAFKKKFGMAPSLLLRPLPKSQCL